MSLLPRTRSLCSAAAPCADRAHGTGRGCRKPAARRCGSPSRALAALFKASDEANFARNPIAALCRGDDCAMPTGSATACPTHITPPSGRRRSDELAALARIDRKRADRRRADFATMSSNGSAKLDLRGCQPDLLALTAVRPIDHFNGLPHWLRRDQRGRAAWRRSRRSRITTTGCSRVDDFVARPSTCRSRA